MKKFLLTMAVALTALFATAQTKTYTDNLVVTIDGESTEPQETTISVAENADGTYCLSLNNFVLGGMIQVGNIVVDNIQATDKHGIKEFATVQNINITAGEGNADDWLGPMLGEVPVDIKGKMTDEKLYCTIDIDMSATLGQVIYVTFGSDMSAVVNTKEYTDNLVVTIDGESTEPQETTIYVTEYIDGTYSLSLNNFVLGGMIQVGNIVVDNIQATEENGIKSFATLQNIIITAGEGNADDWLGPMLGEVPVDIKGKMTDEKLYCTIDIDMSATLEQVIYVTFGSDMSAVVNTKEYTDNLVVTIDGESTEPQETTIYVTEYIDGTYSLSLNNFVLGGMIQVGNIVVDNIQATEENGIKSFATLQNIIITAGEGNADDWLGPMLGEVPVDIKGKMTDEKLYCTIDIDMSATLEQVIYVTFGTEFEEEKKPEIDLNKAYRVKNIETGNYLNVAAYNADNTTGPTGSVTVAEAAVNGDQIFNVEDAGEGKYYLVSLNGHYIVCRPWNVDACNDGQKTVLGFEFTNGTDFNITCDKGYFKVENVGGVNYPFCDAPAAAAATWTLEEIEVPEGIDNIVENTVKVIYDITGRRVNAVTAPGIYIINGKKCIVK